MTKKIMPGEMFIVEYVNGAFVNKWAINDSKDYIELGDGRKAAAGFTDVLIQPEEGQFIDSRYHVVSNAEAIKMVTDVGFGKFTFAEINLTKLKVLKETKIYSRTGVALGTIPAGSEIGTDDASAGNSMRHLMVANCFNDGSGWKFINQQVYSYGFINVQQGHGLERFEESRNLETAVSPESKVDWDVVAEVINTNEPEQVLRGDLSALSKEQVVEKVADHFAAVDLAEVELRDPLQFFANSKNKEFVKRQLNKVSPQKSNDFDSEAQRFNA